ncbi:hypothetical protein ABET11_06020 [Priestia megaterium]|jgi:hypothetical protein|uniref:Uncharacterized protein n=5 Tax=Priestia TaxID=2800373 RepID=D5E1Z1_PRIM1|nr:MULTISPECIES: hypothetical protein [Priestia]AVX09634.1 hypothetical protein CS527_18635 [Bacillus sp. Y-01]KOP75752.1 hypothetical protein AMS61_15915 [Bacillus sp. FJAT-21351]KQU22581.1 hypothetical protein ASG61_03225 [Bacillus sp. Leaf75]KRD90114.1 hypothetical protein ASE51_05785 [Bacillus sp. Root147]KRF57051.1 hypothetical protein ASG98_08510 [Bacillus sp. Soil531]MBZ5481221.1 hypothetical protein [Bacillus sp. T_4]MCF6797584.1 hypothetical protein [Bacillus sp. ET1]MCJ7985155.1 h
MKKYEVTFHLINGEISHLVEAKSLIRAKNYIQYRFEDKSKILDLANDLVIVKRNVQYFTVVEKE